MRRLLLPLLVAAFSLGAVTWAAASGSSGREGKPDGGEHHEKKSDKDGDKKDKSRHDGDDHGKGSKPDKDEGHRDDKDGDRDDKDDKGKDDDGDRDDDDKGDRDDDDKGDRDDKDDDGDRDDDGDGPGDDDDGPGGGNDGPGTTPPNTPGPPGTPGTAGPSGTPGQPAQPTTQPAAPQQPTLLVRGTSVRKCASVRSFRIRIRESSRQRLRWARVQVNGKTVKVVRGDRLRARVNLTGLPKGRFSVRIIALTTSGKRLSATRRYRTCTPKQPRQYKGRL